ncbi:MAG: hypothetical protein ABIG28_01455 [archaeon]
MPKKKKASIRNTFMKSFVNQLIANSYSSDKEKIKEMAQKLEGEEKPVSLSRIMPSPSSFQEGIMQSQQQMQKMPELPPLPQIISSQRVTMPLVMLSQQPHPPMHGINQQPVNLGKVTSFLRDPAVINIECRGPGKNILVNRSGTIQTTPLILTKDEINSITNEVSNKTRIPLIPGGMFKAAFQDLVMTAVISEFVGTRFLIQKMNPFQKNY